MHDLPDMDSLRAVLDQPLDAKIHQLLTDCLVDTVQCRLEALTHLLVVEAGDTEQQVIDAIGFSPLRSRIDGVPDSPDWDWLEKHDGFWEILYCVGDSGFAYILLIEDADGSPFAALCRNHKSCG